MKKYIIMLVIIFIFAVLFPAIPPHSWYSKIILKNQSIIPKLGLKKENCHYEEATMLIESRSAKFVCKTAEKYRLASDKQKTVIDNMRNILEEDNWKFSEKESWKFWDITYTKGFRKIRIYPYNWGAGCTGVTEDGYDSCKLFVYIQ